MASRMRWRGLDELRDALQTMPTDLTHEATPIVREAATTAATDMRATYPRRTGRLANSLVQQEQPRGEHAINVQLQNTAPYAHFFEFGTRYAPPGRVFVPIFDQHQREMIAEVTRLFPRFNLRPHGDATD